MIYLFIQYQSEETGDTHFSLSTPPYEPTQAEISQAWQVIPPERLGLGHYDRALLQHSVAFEVNSQDPPSTEEVLEAFNQSLFELGPDSTWDQAQGIVQAILSIPKTGV